MNKSNQNKYNKPSCVRTFTIDFSKTSTYGNNERHQQQSKREKAFCRKFGT